MAFTNIPPNLQDLFAKLANRVNKLETAPNSAQSAADAAQATADQALADAAVALADASAAYTLAGTAIQGSTNTILNAQNQMTAINGNGITIYSGASATSGARVVLNSDGIAGFNSSGTSTFAIDATNGNVSITGASFTSGTIYGGSMNINGNFIVNSSGYLTATGAAVTGTITTSSLSASGGNIAGWTILSDRLTATGGTTILNSNGNINASGLIYGVGGLSSNSGLNVFSGGATIQGSFYNTGHATTTSTANAYINSSSGLLARSTSSQRYKVEIEPQDIPKASIMALQPKSYIDKGQYEANGDSDIGLQRLLGLIAEDVVEIPVLGEMLANRNAQGQPDSVNYDRIAVALIPLLKDHEARLKKLEGN